MNGISLWIDLSAWEEIKEIVGIKARVFVLLKCDRPTLLVFMEEAGWIPYRLFLYPQITHCSDWDEGALTFGIGKLVLIFYNYSFWGKEARKKYLSGPKTLAVMEDGEILKGRESLFKERGLILSFEEMTRRRMLWRHQKQRKSG